MATHGGKKAVLYLQLPTTDYIAAWNLQKVLARARGDKKLETDVVILLQHFPVFTVGRRGDVRNLTVSEAFLKRVGIPVVPVERGGDITYHAPGQVVIYPIIHLDASNLKIDSYISRLEEMMLRTLQSWDIDAERNSLNRGVWVDNRKIGSVGICVRQGVSFHGLALNVNLSLEPFGWIHPCGLRGIEMTSMQRELCRALAVEDVGHTLMENMKIIFDIEFQPVTRAELASLIEDAAWQGEQAFHERAKNRSVILE